MKLGSLDLTLARARSAAGSHIPLDGALLLESGDFLLLEDGTSHLLGESA